MLIREPHCKGFESNLSRTVEAWIADQDLLSYNHSNDEMAALISLKNSIMPGRLSGNADQLFYTACYDIDRFREQVFAQGRWADFISEDAPVRDQADDAAMLKFGMRIVMNFMRNRRADLCVKL
jgi:hypothetical protein